MKAMASTESIHEILIYFDKINKIELDMESLPYESIADWRERLKIKEKREKMSSEIIRIRAMLRDKMGPYTKR
jgi:hypothetical protein